MGWKLAAALSALVLAAAPAVAQQQPGWSYAYVEGVATATQRDDAGRVTATMTCRPPDGDIIVTDFTFGRAARRVTSAALSIGNLTINVPATVEGRGRNARVLVRLPQRPPILAGAQPHDRLTVAVNDVRHTYLEGSATQMKDLAYACWGDGSN